MNLNLVTFRAGGKDLFKEAKAVKETIGQKNYANCVDHQLDTLEARMAKGVVYYDPVKKVILADRAALLECLCKHGAVGVPSRG